MGERAAVWTGLGAPQVLVSGVSDWQTLIEDLSSSDNGGSPVTQPGQLPESRRLEIAQRGTIVLVRGRYVSLPTTPPTVALFGGDGAGHYWPLANFDGDYAVPLTADADRDVQDGDGNAHTVAVAFDAQGADHVVAAIEESFVGDDAADSALQLKVI